MTDPQSTSLVPVANLFEGHEIRTIEKDRQVWIPCRDLSLALGLDRSTLYQHVKRNRDFFGEDAIDGDILSPDDGDLWVNEGGLYTLLARVSVGRVTPSAKSAIIKFRKSVPELIQKFRKGELAAPQQPPQLMDPFVRELERAEAFSRITGVPLPLAQVQALKKAGEETGEDNHRYIELLRPTLSSDRKGNLSPSQIGEKLSPRRRGYEINEYLYRNGFQVRSSEDQTKWVPTEKGKPFSYWHPYIAENGHAAYQLLWFPEILRASGLVRG